MHERQHRRIGQYNRVLYSHGCHPETRFRMETLGLSKEDMEIANDRRHWLAMLRIHKCLRQNPGIKSINAISKLARAAWRTVKIAIALTWEQVLTGVRQAFRTLSCSLAKDIEIKRVASLQKKLGQAAQTVGRGLGSAIQKCLKMASKPTQEQKTGSGVVKSTRRNEEREMAIRFQRENEGTKTPKNDGISIKLRRHETKTRLRHRSEPEAWMELKKELHQVLNRIKTRMQAKINQKDPQYPNSSAYTR